MSDFAPSLIIRCPTLAFYVRVYPYWQYCQKVHIFGTARLATNQNRYSKSSFGTPLDYTYAHWQILDEIRHWEKKNFAWLLFCSKFDGFTLVLVVRPGNPLWNLFIFRFALLLLLLFAFAVTYATISYDYTHMSNCRLGIIFRLVFVVVVVVVVVRAPAWLG